GAQQAAQGAAAEDGSPAPSPDTPSDQGPMRTSYVPGGESSEPHTPPPHGGAPPGEDVDSPPDPHDPHDYGPSPNTGPGPDRDQPPPPRPNGPEDINPTPPPQL